MLFQQEGQQHEEASVVDDPPHVHRALQTLLVTGETVDVLSHQQGLVGRGGLPHRLWRRACVLLVIVVLIGLVVGIVIAGLVAEVLLLLLVLVLYL